MCVFVGVQDMLREGVSVSESVGEREALHDGLGVGVVESNSVRVGVGVLVGVDVGLYD